MKVCTEFSEFSGPDSKSPNSTEAVVSSPQEIRNHKTIH